MPDEFAKGPARLTAFFSAYGQVLSVTVRKKPPDAPGAPPRSWALLTYKLPAEASACLAASKKKDGVRVPTAADGERPGDTVRLAIKAAQLEKQLRKKDTGALAAIGQQQAAQLAAAVKIQAAMRGRLNRTKKGGGGGGGGGGGRSRRESSGSGSSSGSRSRRSSSEKSGGGGGEGGGQARGLDDGSTLWVGGLPDEFAKGPAQLSSLLTAEYGAVLSATVRKKPVGEDGAHKSWALVTFRNETAAGRCLANGCL